MKVALSDRELAVVYGHMRGNIWGNNEETLLDQEELWRVLDLEKRFDFLSKEPSTKLEDIPNDLNEYDLSYGAITLLRSYLARPGQPMGIGVISAKALRRIG